nr:ribosome biogenesis factor YjgA [uncultured Desulfobacter sp.]
MTLPPDKTPDEALSLSKTKKKKMAENLQKLGEELSRLAVNQLEQLDLEPDLFKALVDAKSITSNVAARRHRQYIGTLMRQADSESILEALEQLKASPMGLYTHSPDVASQADQEIQVLLDKLLAWDDDAMETVLAAAPDTDRQQLRQVIRNANKEISQKKKNSKSLQALKEMIARI